MISELEAVSFSNNNKVYKGSEEIILHYAFHLH